MPIFGAFSANHFQYSAKAFGDLFFLRKKSSPTLPIGRFEHFLNVSNWRELRAVRHVPFWAFRFMSGVLWLCSSTLDGSSTRVDVQFIPAHSLINIYLICGVWA